VERRRSSAASAPPCPAGSSAESEALFDDATLLRLSHLLTVVD
jgi:hypothetical protein